MQSVTASTAPGSCRKPKARHRQHQTFRRMHLWGAPGSGAVSAPRRTLPGPLQCPHVECAGKAQRRRRYGPPVSPGTLKSGIALRWPPHSITGLEKPSRSRSGARSIAPSRRARHRPPPCRPPQVRAQHRRPQDRQINPPATPGFPPSLARRREPPHRPARP